MPAQVSLAMFHLQAPWIAGGRSGKARRIGESLLAMSQDDTAGGAGFWGRFVRVQYELNEKDWDDARDEYRSGLDAAERDEDRVRLAMVYASGLTSAEKHPERAVAALDAARGWGLDEASAAAMIGQAWHAAGAHDKAVEPLAYAVEHLASARHTRYRLAESFEKLGRDAEAADAYEAFAGMYPDDDRASRALKRARKLRR